MAPSPKFLSFLFLLTFFFMQIHAREGQFFSKVTPATTTTTTTINSNNAKETTLPNKEQSFKEQDEEPSFVPETQSYGLYGQESTQLPTTIPTTTTKLGNAPYRTSTYRPYKTETSYNQETYTNYPYSNTNNNNYYRKNNQYNNNPYEEEQQNYGETSLQENSYNSRAHQTNNHYYNGRSGYTDEGKQGMSDTRYLENGKFYYDVKNENNYYPNQYRSSRNNYGTNGNYHNNNENSYEYNNSMERYQNPEDFQDSQDEQYVP